MSHRISDHAHPRHRGPHHDIYIHDENKEATSVSTSKRGSHELGDKSHLESMKGEPHGGDVAGHKGQMKW